MFSHSEDDDGVSEVTRWTSFGQLQLTESEEVFSSWVIGCTVCAPMGFYQLEYIASWKKWTAGRTLVTMLVCGPSQASGNSVASMCKSCLQMRECKKTDKATSSAAPPVNYNHCSANLGALHQESVCRAHGERS